MEATCNPRVKVLGHYRKDMLSDDEKQAIDDMKRICVKSIELEAKMQREIYALEEKYQAEHAVLYDERKMIIEGIRQKHKGDPVDQNMGCFWLQVLRTAIMDSPEYGSTIPISDTDADVLSHISDIRSKLDTEPELRFSIYFYFDRNVYFENEYLFKTYWIKCKADPDEPQAYDGSQIYRTQGCYIQWADHAITGPYRKSFFKFFTPPQLPYPGDRKYNAINENLEKDFQFGFYLKEHVIPKAAYFFTGEINGSSSGELESDSDSDSKDGDEAIRNGSDGDRDDEVDEDDDDEHEDGPLYGDPALLDSEQWYYDNCDFSDSDH